MTRYAFEDQGSKQFEWPEPLVIDVINEYYSHVVEPCDRLTISRLHQRTLRALYLGEGKRSAVLRFELIAFCAARNIRPETIAKVDRVVYSELVNLVSVTCRTSPRLVTLVVERLQAALGPFTTELAEPRPAYLRFIPRPALAAHVAVA